MGQRGSREGLRRRETLTLSLRPQLRIVSSRCQVAAVLLAGSVSETVELPFQPAVAPWSPLHEPLLAQTSMELARQAGDRTDTQTHAQETEPMVTDYFCFSLSSGSRAINSIPFPPNKHSLCTGDCQEVKKFPLGPTGASFLPLCPSRRRGACGVAVFDGFLCCF